MTGVAGHAERHDERAAGDRRHRALSDGEAGSSDHGDDADATSVGGGGLGFACWTGKVVPGKRTGDEADRNTEEEHARQFMVATMTAAIEGPATLITPRPWSSWRTPGRAGGRDRRGRSPPSPR